MASLPEKAERLRVGLRGEQRDEQHHRHLAPGVRPDCAAAHYAEARASDDELMRFCQRPGGSRRLTIGPRHPRLVR